MTTERQNKRPLRVSSVEALKLDRTLISLRADLARDLCEPQPPESVLLRGRGRDDG